MKLHTTDMRTFADCRLRWWFSVFKGQRPNLPPSPLFIGSLFHEGVDWWHKTFIRSNDEAQAEAIGMDAIATKARATFNHPSFIHSALHTSTDHYAEDVELVTNMFHNFCLWAPGRWRPLLSEFSFRVNVPTPKGTKSKCVLLGKVDAVVEFEKRVWLLEIKTASPSSKGEAPERDLDIQMGAYAWAVQQGYFPVEGVLRLAAYKTLPKKPELTTKGKLSRRKITTTYEHVMAAIEEHNLNPNDYADWLDELEGAPHPCFRIERCPRSKTELRLIERRLYNLYRQMSQPTIYPNEGIFCRRCSYKEPCVNLNRGLDWEFVLEEDFHYGPRPN